MQMPSRIAAPRKRSLANAKPASVQNVTVPRVTSPETMNELSSPWLSGASSRAFLMLPNSDVLGSRGGVSAAISALVWDAITIV